MERISADPTVVMETAIFLAVATSGELHDAAEEQEVVVYPLLFRTGYNDDKRLPCLPFLRGQQTDVHACVYGGGSDFGGGGVTVWG